MVPSMKALSLTAPWGLFCLHALKRWETRSYPTRFRGRLALHTSKGFPLWARQLCREDRYFVEALARLNVRLEDIPLGVVIGAVDLVDCQRITAANAPPYPERAFGDYTPGRFMYCLANPIVLPEPVPYKGALGWWDFRHPVVDYLSKGAGSPTHLSSPPLSA